MIYREPEDHRVYDRARAQQRFSGLTPSAREVRWLAFAATTRGLNLFDSRPMPQAETCVVDRELRRYYSWRSAMTGSTREARRAGMRAAERPSPANVRIAAISVNPSHGLTPNRMVETILPPAAASGRPTSSPATTGVIDSVRIPRNTVIGRAPSAMRTPISAVRRATEYDMRP